MCFKRSWTERNGRFKKSDEEVRTMKETRGKCKKK